MKTTLSKTGSAPDKSKGNKKAILGRLRHRNDVQANAQNRHDMRAGFQPKYVDGNRREMNDVLIPPLGGAELRQICTARRDQRGLTKRAKKDGMVATTGLIAFGVEAQVWFEKLDRATQNRAFQEIASSICRRCNTTLTGLVVHRDESAVHAHFQMPAYNMLGSPLTKSMTRADYSRLQDLVAEAIVEFEPKIERGNRKWDRLAAGADYQDTVHRAVKHLHQDLPIEIASTELELADLRMAVSATFAEKEKVELRVRKLREEETLSEAKAKRLKVYELRLANHVARYHEARTKLREAQAAVAAQKETASQLLASAVKMNEEARQQQSTLLEGVALIADGSLWIEQNQWKAPKAAPELRARLRPLLNLLLPLYTRLTNLFETLKREQQKVNEERQALAADRAKAANIIAELNAVRGQLGAEQAAKLDSAREDLGLTF